ncbi:hypothetical protein BJ322DRAFT_1040278 [Thelephora terrestris]|uniref:Uncharacterized protein n=1 Tax=Thelephora terrestris TaxID=56493 RepID=A0A9P6HNF3_9AGAM|nr:hypothetical protein BJ322DRAFT_1040278 [Thelephora terrestris]
MPALPTHGHPSSLVAISSDPGAITVSTDPSPARSSDTWSHAQTHPWNDMTDRSIASESPAFRSCSTSPVIASRVPSLLPTRTSSPTGLPRSMLSSHLVAPSLAISTCDPNIELEYTAREALLAENRELRGCIHAMERAYRYLERLSDEIDRFAADIQKIANGIIPDHAPGSSPGPTSSPESIPIPRRKYVTVQFEPQQEIFVYVKHWTPKQWNALRHPRKGTVLEHQIESVNVPFCEDANGNVVPRSPRS